MKFNKLYRLLNEANVNNLAPLFQKYFLMSPDITKKYNSSNNYSYRISYNVLDSGDKAKLANYIDEMKKNYSEYVNYITKNPQYQSWVYDMVINLKLVLPEDITDKFYNTVIWLIDYLKLNKNDLLGDFVPILINKDKEYEKKVLESDSLNIKYILNPSEQLQLKLIRLYGGRTIRFLKNPTESTKLAAVKNDSDSLEYINDPTEEIQLVAIQESAFSIKYINNPTRKVLITAIERNPYCIKYIKDPDKELQLLAVKKSYTSISSISNPDKEVQLTAINNFLKEEQSNTHIYLKTRGLSNDNVYSYDLYYKKASSVLGEVNYVFIRNIDPSAIKYLKDKGFNLEV